MIFEEKMNVNANNLKILLAAILSIPVFMALERYMEMFGIRETEAMATAATIALFGFVYLGRKLAIKWKQKIPLPINTQYTILGSLIACNSLFLLIYPGFNTLRHMPGLNLLLHWVPFFLAGTAVGMLIKLVRMNQQALEEATKAVSHSQSELQLLQSQISPHFLFNTLNNLYGISITRHEMIPPLLLKLSELLRYSVYDAKELYVPLKDELAYVNNYIDFEKIRIGDRLVLQTSIADGNDNIRIAPMLLIVFVENAFKHAKNSTDDRIYIDIDLKTFANSILFSVKNSYQQNEESGLAGKYSGFGLDNVKKRLELLYPNQYDLKLESQDNSYQVMLQLKIKE